MNEAALYGLYLAAGAAAGLLAGLFGIGGGLVMVPVLLVGFAIAGLPGDVIPASALGTSLAVIGVTSTLASREHLRLGNLARPFSRAMRRLIVALSAGVLAGSAVSTRLPRDAVLACIAVFEIGIAAWMLRGSFRPAAAGAPAVRSDAPQDRLDPQHAGPFLVLTGAVSSIGGIGGATMMVPYFTRAGIAYPQASALSTFFGCFVGFAGFLSYTVIGRPEVPIPMAVGYVSVPAFASLMLGSLLLVRAGARLSRRLPQKWLTRGFCALLLASGCRLLWPLIPATLVLG